MNPFKKLLGVVLCLPMISILCFIGYCCLTNNYPKPTDENALIFSIWSGLAFGWFIIFIRNF